MSNDKPVEIIVDSRESRSGTFARLSTIPGVSVRQEELSSGDYVVGDGVGVERKAANDFAISLMQGRLFDQIEKMRIEYQQVIVLVEGDPYTSHSDIADVAIDGALSYLALLAGVQVLHSPNVAATVRLIHRMAIHTQHGLDYIPPVRTAKPKASTQVGTYLVEGLPGVGATMARALIGHFGSAHAVFTASHEQLCAVKGVGKKTADGIISALHAKNL
jgi:Fanconi anemia group M protein